MNGILRAFSEGEYETDLRQFEVVAILSASESVGRLEDLLFLITGESLTSASRAHLKQGPYRCPRFQLYSEDLRIAWQ